MAIGYTGPTAAAQQYPWMNTATKAPASNAYATQGVTSNPYTSTDLGALQQQLMGMLSAPSVSYNMPSRDELAASIAAYLRPSYDQAIGQRQKQTLTNRAEIDVDAASRGMGRSSWVTDVKDRAMDAEAADVANLESNYNASLLEQVEQLLMQHQQNKFAADQFNATAQMNAQSAALQGALGLYGNNLDWERQQEQLNKKSGGKSSNNSIAERWDKYFSDLTPVERYSILKGVGSNEAKELNAELKAAGNNVYDAINKKWYLNSSYGAR